MEAATPLADTCRALVRALHQRAHDAPSPSATPPHAGAALLEDHLLTAAALVACLAAGQPQRDLLRLAALTHDLPDAELPSDDPTYAEWVALLRQHGGQLDKHQPPEIPADGPARLLALAHLAASRRLPVARKEDFAQHPLAGADAVELVYGGATRVKQYVFESARLPEIRGASALLDHINRLDLPALWGLEPLFEAEGDVAAAQQQRYGEFHKTAPLDAPECVLYASGGNILALAPAGQGARLAQAIERRYTEQTLVAQSVAVADSFSLLEIQYGRQPQMFWADDARRLLAANPAAAALLGQSYGIADLAANLGALFGADSFGQANTLDDPARKGFGELVTALAALADRRRAGDGVGTGTARFPVFFDLASAARRCASCDIRPAAHHIPPPNDIALCEACRRKRDAGLAAKKGQHPDDQAEPTERLGWILPWGAWLETKSEQLGRTREIKATASTLPDIAEAASGQAGGFVGLVYADGNNVGAYIAGLASIAAYRRFAQRMLAANERAVASALLDHLGPREQNKIWPFEIITIGGDDVLLFVPADRAPAVAATIAREFDAAMKTYAIDITLSAGVLLMADHTPIRFARDLVESLLKSAKQHSKDRGKVATIDFMALKAASMVSESIGAYRGAAFSRVRKHRDDPTRETRLQLTQRPYTLEDFAKLLDAGRALITAKFPRSQLHQLAEIVGEGQQLRSSVDYRYFVGRGRGRERDGYAAFEDAVRTLCGPEDSAPWRRVKGEPRPEYNTPLLDLVEILPFVGAAEREERA